MSPSYSFLPCLGRESKNNKAFLELPADAKREGRKARCDRQSHSPFARTKIATDANKDFRQKLSARLEPKRDHGHADNQEHHDTEAKKRLVDHRVGLRAQTNKKGISKEGESIVQRKTLCVHILWKKKMAKKIPPQAGLFSRHHFYFLPAVSRFPAVNR
jgi:hypothetical protein